MTPCIICIRRCYVWHHSAWGWQGTETHVLSKTSRTFLECIHSPLQRANGVSLPEGKVAGAFGWQLIFIEYRDQWWKVVTLLLCTPLWRVVFISYGGNFDCSALCYSVTKSSHVTTSSTATFGSNDDEFDLHSCGIRQKLLPRQRVSWRRVFLVLFCHSRQIPEYSPQIWPRPYLKGNLHLIFLIL